MQFKFSYLRACPRTSPFASFASFASFVVEKIFPKFTPERYIHYGAGFSTTKDAKDTKGAQEPPKILVLGQALTAVFIVTIVAACGGGSSGSDLLIEGTLTEAGGAGHSRIAGAKHSEGQRIDGVEICALGECSTTNTEGQWGFEVSSSAEGEVLFSVVGHGIDTNSIVEIPHGATEVVIDFQHVEGGAVEAQHVTVDGSTDHLEPHEHEEQE